MNIDYSSIKPNLDNYLSVLLGLSNTSSNYIVTYDRAMELTKGLEDVIIKLGNNPFMNGTYVCPWSELAQKLFICITIKKKHYATKRRWTLGRQKG